MKVEDSLSKTYQWNVEDILCFDPKYVWALTTSKRWKHWKTLAGKPWEENHGREIDTKKRTLVLQACFKKAQCK